MELENIILSEISQSQKGQKITCSPSYVDYRPKINAVILLNMGRTCTERIGKVKENWNLNVVDVLTIEERI
jgi:hypothetical protein